MNGEITTEVKSEGACPVFAGRDIVEWQRIANILMASDLVPDFYKPEGKVKVGDRWIERGKEKAIANILVALSISQNLNKDPLVVMQKLYAVNGKTGWEASYLISCFNTCGRFSAINYEQVGVKGTDSAGFIAYATELSTKEKHYGSAVTIAMAVNAGWWDKKGSLWPVITEQMLRYRAAAFFIKATAPEISMGYITIEELKDIQEEESPPTVGKKGITRFKGLSKKEVIESPVTVNQEKEPVSPAVSEEAQDEFVMQMGPVSSDDNMGY